jgi:hypothetical protein
VCAVHVKTVFNTVCANLIPVCNFNGTCGSVYLSERRYICEINIQGANSKWNPGAWQA